MLKLTKIKNWVYNNAVIVWFGAVIVTLFTLMSNAAHKDRTRHDGMEMVCWSVASPEEVKTVFPVGSGTLYFNDRTATYSGRGLRYKMNDGEMCTVRKPS